tara:strand:+ start:2185 stop:3897 length:1713 start_codon:yes stop_codon:yes gene_type:complete
MKLLIILTLLSVVTCGINNSITIFNNDTIYLANTNNSAIYKLTKNANKYEKKVVIGHKDALKKGNISNYNGLEARLTNPRSIINDFDKRVLFFIDNDDKCIKRSTINNLNNKGIEISLIVDTSVTNIYEEVANNYAGYSNDEYLFFVSSCNLHKIDLANDEDEDVNATDINITNTSSNLDSGSNFINISYYNSSLFYCYKTSTDRFYFKKSNSEHNYSINENISLDINYTEYLQHIKGFTFIEHNTCNLLLVTGTSNNDTKICKFDYIDNNTINHIISYSTDTKYSALIDYKAIYGSDANYNGSIIGRTYRSGTSRNGFNKIKITGNNPNLNEENETVINMLQGGNIKISTTNSTSEETRDYLINTNIIYNNIINTNNQDNDYRIIHFNNEQNKINLIKYSKANFSTYKMNFNIDNTNIDNFSVFNNNIIQNITITQNNILYIALYDEINGISKIYTCSNPIDNLTITNQVDLSSVELEEQGKINGNGKINGKILAMNYLLSENNTDELHYITNESYNKYNINNNTNVILENIRKTNNTDALNNINDFIIDTDYEIGYIAFETRLKWFYY